MPGARTAIYTKALLASRAVLRGDCAEGIVDDLLLAAIQASDAQDGLVVLLGADGEHEVRAARDREGRVPEAARTSRSLVRRALDAHQPLLLGDAPADGGTLHELRIQSVIAAPLYSRERPLGALVVHKKPFAGTPFNEEERERVALIADVAAHALTSLLAREAAARELEEERRRDRDAPRLSWFVGSSKRFLDFYAQVEMAAASEVTALVEGETGTGKELVARALHALSPRAEKPFVAVNMAALGENLIEAALFGHVKGAFTGADRAAPGFFRQADGGTIFLDECGEMPLPLQAKLLRVLQEQVVHPVGSSEGVPIDVRVVAATNKSLARLVAEGRFREDLHFRLNVFSLTTPPLRERREDIPLLTRHFLAKHSKGQTTPALSAASLRALEEHEWRGNVRELENAIQRALVFKKDPIEPAHLRLEVARAAECPDEEGLFSERDRALAVYERSGGSMKMTAAVMGVSLPTLYRRFQRWGVKLR